MVEATQESGKGRRLIACCDGRPQLTPVPAWRPEPG